MRRRLVALLAAGLSSCTFLQSGPVTIPVAVQPVEDLKVLAEGGGRTVYVVQPFIDDRSAKTACGTQKKRYGMQLGGVACSNDPAAALSRLFAEELRAAGFRLVPTVSKDDKTTLRLEGRLQQFFVEPVRGIKQVETDIGLQLIARSGSGLDANRQFYQKGRGGDFQRSVNSAVRQMLTALVDATGELMDRYSGIGISALSKAGAEN